MDGIRYPALPQCEPLDGVEVIVHGDDCFQASFL